MFRSIHLTSYDSKNKCNHYTLIDSCFYSDIISPYNSPSLIKMKDNDSNTITLYSIIHHYQYINRYIPSNIAHYYNWLMRKGYYVDNTFIKTQLSLLDKHIGTNLYHPYYKAIVSRLNSII